MKIKDFVNKTTDEINNFFNNQSYEQLVKFAENNNIPYKKRYTKNKLKNLIIEEVQSTITFMKIATINKGDKIKWNKILLLNN